MLKSAAVFRCRKDGSRVEVYARGLRHPKGSPALDASGNLFCVDGGGADGASRLVHVAENSDFG